MSTPTITADTNVIVGKVETIAYSQTFTVEELEEYAATTLADAGSVDALIDAAQNRDAGFYERVERHGDCTDSTWTVTVGEPTTEAPAPAVEYEHVEDVRPYAVERARTMLRLYSGKQEPDRNALQDMLTDLFHLAAVVDAEYADVEEDSVIDDAHRMAANEADDPTGEVNVTTNELPPATVAAAAAIA